MDMKYVYRKNSQIMDREMDDGPVLIDPYRRTLVRLNPAAHRIWQLLDGQRSAEGIIKIMEAEFEIDAKSLQNDVAGFLKELQKREIIK